MGCVGAPKSYDSVAEGRTIEEEDHERSSRFNCFSRILSAEGSLSVFTKLSKRQEASFVWIISSYQGGRSINLQESDIG